VNWLAHLHLSEPTPAFRIGNLLPDFLKQGELDNLPAEFQPGIRMHRRIDAFTDAHPVVRGCVIGFQPPFRRFGGILTDVFFDHLLACRWEEYSPVSLDDFASEVYEEFELFRERIPTNAYDALQRMRRENWLCSYRSISGIETIIRRIGRRLRRPVDLTGATSEFLARQREFELAFGEFFPELIAHTQLPV